MWIKICANTNLADAHAVAALGADAVGFVFAPSTRQVTAAQVKPISAALPPTVERVGVFHGGSAEEIATAALEAGLTAIQLHGGLDLDFAQPLRDRLGDGIELIHTAHWTLGEDDASADRLRQQLSGLAGAEPNARILIDTKSGAASGGTGKPFPWDRAAAVFASQPTLRIIVAGGLRPDNVAEAIQKLHPWGVDVASGVESAPGVKDHLKLQAFIENARRADRL